MGNIKSIKMKKQKALILIDLQNDYFEGGLYPLVGSLDAVLKAIDYEKTKAEQEAKFKEALSEDDYAKVLRVFNEKGLISSIGHFLGVVDKEYCNRVLALLNGKLHGEISDAISGYLPPEIPR